MNYTTTHNSRIEWKDAPTITMFVVAYKGCGNNFTTQEFFERWENALDRAVYLSKWKVSQGEFVTLTKGLDQYAKIRGLC